MKKKSFASSKDKRDWIEFTKNIGNLNPKEADLEKFENKDKKIRKLDLHGYSLNDSNEIVKKFIIDSYNNGYKKLLIITGKGSRSKSYNDPYISKELSVLKNHVPEFISSDKDLSNKIVKISQASIKDGGEGAIYVFLKKIKE